MGECSNSFPGRKLASRDDEKIKLETMEPRTLLTACIFASMSSSLVKIHEQICSSSPR